MIFLKTFKKKNTFMKSKNIIKHIIKMCLWKKKVFYKIWKNT